MIGRPSLLAACLVSLIAVMIIAAQTSPQAKQQEASDSKQLCPLISVSCPPGFKKGEQLWFTATVLGGNENVKPAYFWAVSPGKILQGQGSSAITVATTASNGDSITAAVTISGFDLTCPATASCSLLDESGMVSPSRRLGSYGARPRNKEIAQLNAFAVQLEAHPGTSGYLLVYGARRGRAAESQDAIGRAKAYLVKRRGIDAGRIVTVDAGFKEELTIELWIVPSGAVPPRPESTLDSTETKIIRTRQEKSAQSKPGL